jgi:hypothetical protein
MRVTTTAIVTLVLVLFTLDGGSAKPLTPLVLEWDRYFTIEAQPGRPGGTIWNTSDWGTQRIQLLVEGLDGSGQTLEQRVMWLGIDLPAGSHAYFDAPMAPAQSYRVRVFAFDLETNAGPR